MTIIRSLAAGLRTPPVALEMMTPGADWGFSTDDAKVRRIVTLWRSRRQYQQHVGYYTNSKTGVVGLTPSIAKVIRHATGIRVRRSQILVRFA